MSELKDIIGQVINPITSKTLGEEERILSVEEKSDQLHVTYNRDGISPQDKRKIEDEIIKKLEGKFADDKIFIFTKSTESKEVYKAIGSDAPKKAAKPAELKVGHGQVGEKKSIEGVKNIIAIGSGKGGVGKSTVTSNIAATLVSAGHTVGIVDADIYGPSIPMLFNRRGERPEATMDKKIIPLENHGVKFISFGNFIHEDEPVVWRGPMLGGVLNQFFFDTDWGELDYLLIDLPPGTGDVQLSMVQNLNVDGAIIVSTPQDVALLDARKALHMFDKLKVHVIGMVENMSSFICDSCNKEHFIYGTGGVKVACGEIGVGFLGSIPLEMSMRKGADFGTPYMSQDKYEGHKGWKAYKELGQRLDSYFNPDDNKKKSLLSKIFNKENKVKQ
jgi:ATP-binding protein involved in chromosome partitioning